MQSSLDGLLLILGRGDRRGRGGDRGRTRRASAAGPVGAGGAAVAAGRGVVEVGPQDSIVQAVLHPMGLARRRDVHEGDGGGLAALARGRPIGGGRAEAAVVLVQELHALDATEPTKKDGRKDITCM